MTSRHYTADRNAREELIKRIGNGTAITTIKVDRGHRNGAELHTITTTGIIEIRNERTHKLITKLIARPQQIKRYFTTTTKEIRRTEWKNVEYIKNKGWKREAVETIAK